MLPAGTPYIDAYPNMVTEEAIEQLLFLMISIHEYRYNVGYCHS